MCVLCVSTNGWEKVNKSFYKVGNIYQRFFMCSTFGVGPPLFPLHVDQATSHVAITSFVNVQPKEQL